MIDLLADGNGRAKVQTKGLRLITKIIDPTNRRRQLLKLTPEGLSMVNLAKQIAYG